MDPTTTQLLGDASGVRPAFEADGVAYRVGHPTQAAKARYESLIVAAEKDVIERMAADGVLTPAERRDAYAALTRQVAQEQAHRCGGSLWASYFRGDKQTVGLALFQLALLEVSDGDGGFRPATIADLPAAVALLADEAAQLAFAEVVPFFLKAVADALPARQRTPEVLAAVAAALATRTPSGTPS